ncbi:MAG: signal peptidase I [Bacilli bacterium]|jgi:signal peptidase I|nr:signal peptidase I [Bacilli bacterium]
MKKSKVRILKGILSTIFCFEIGILVFIFFLVPIKIDGPSMEPNLYNNERAFMGRKNFIKSMPKYNDVVVVKVENGLNELIIKRAIGLPNDTIAIKDNKIYVNGAIFDDHYRSPDTKMNDMAEIKLSDDEIFVLGDNRNVSLDSRSLGPIKLSQVKAIDGFVYWPLNKIHFME